MSRVYSALVHHPVTDKTGATVATAITNLDVHDLARAARTYELGGYYIVTPVTAQRAIVDKIRSHWETGPGRKRVPERWEALRLIRPVTSVEEAVASIEAETGRRPRVFVTGARAPEGRGALSAADGSRMIRSSDVPSLILFGTGHGLAPELVIAADEVLAPIRPGADYNHLSVRAAHAITLDRLFGDAGAPRDTTD